MSRTLKRLLLSIGTGSAGARFLLIYLFADPPVHACTMYARKQPAASRLLPVPAPAYSYLQNVFEILKFLHF